MWFPILTTQSTSFYAIFFLLFFTQSTSLAMCFFFLPAPYSRLHWCVILCKSFFLTWSSLILFLYKWYRGGLYEIFYYFDICIIIEKVIFLSSLCCFWIAQAGGDCHRGLSMELATKFFFSFPSTYSSFFMHLSRHGWGQVGGACCSRAPGILVSDRQLISPRG